MARPDDRLEQLTAHYGLPPRARAALRALLEFQAADEHAPTTVRAPDVAVDRHVADSLAALRLSEVRRARRIADIGAGAGWPGLALAAARPEARVTLVESASRRSQYLRRAVVAAGLDNVDVVHARAEAWPEGSRRHDLVTARALAALPVLCEYAAPLLEIGGSLVAWKGSVDDAELETGAAAAKELGLTPTAVEVADPYPGAGPATLHVFRKTSPTPSAYPRRPGMALKRPLGR